MVLCSSPPEAGELLTLKTVVEISVSFVSEDEVSKPRVVMEMETETSARFASPDSGFLDFAEVLGKPSLLLSVFEGLDPSASLDYTSAHI